MGDAQTNGTGDAGTPLMDQAKQQAQQTVQQGQQLVGQGWEWARAQFRAQLHSQKDRAAASVGDLAQTLRETGNQLRQQGHGNSSQYAERFADRMTDFSQSVQSKDIEELLRDTEEFARARPAAFLTIAAVLGFLLTRFLKSSDPRLATAA